MSTVNRLLLGRCRNVNRIDKNIVRSFTTCARIHINGSSVMRWRRRRNWIRSKSNRTIDFIHFSNNDKQICTSIDVQHSFHSLLMYYSEQIVAVPSIRQGHCQRKHSDPTGKFFKSNKLFHSMYNEEF